MTKLSSVIPGADAWASEGEGERARVGAVVLHGFTGNPISVRPLAERINAEGYAVDVPRLPGHGTSWQDLSRTRYGDWKRTVVQAVDRLRTGCDQVVLVGLSVGGTLALDVASERDDIAGIVTINTLVLDRTDPIAKIAPILSMIVPVVPSKMAGIAKNDMAKPGGDEQAYAYTPSKAGHSLQRELPRIRGQLRNVKVPVLVAYSPQDHTVPAANSQALRELLGSDDVAELVLDRSYHLATLDWDAELLFDTAVNFIRRVTGV